MSFHPAEDNGEFRNHFYHEFGKESYGEKPVSASKDTPIILH